MGRKKKEQAFIAAPGTFVQSEEQARIEKDFAKVLGFQRKQANNLLGTFGESGYEISEEFMKELVAVPKRFDRIENNVLYAATKLGEFVLNFKIEMEMGGSFCEAKLFIIEIEQGFEEDVKHTTLLAHMLEPYIFEFRKKVCEEWNVFYSDEMKEKNDVIYQYLHMQYEQFSNDRDPVEFVAHLYMVRMREILEKIGLKGEEVKRKYSELLQKFMERNGGVVPDDAVKKRILDNALMLTNGLEEVLKTEEGTNLMRGVNRAMLDIHEKKNELLLNEVSPTKKEEKKEEKTVKSSESKPKLKSSGSGSKSAAKPSSTAGGSAFTKEEIKLRAEDLNFSPPPMIPPQDVLIAIAGRFAGQQMQNQQPAPQHQQPTPQRPVQPTPQPAPTPQPVPPQSSQIEADARAIGEADFGIQNLLRAANDAKAMEIAGEKAQNMNIAAKPHEKDFSK